ncbi:MAG: polyribonucleotide nucleotidyltransferase [Christensenellaceae bacterium]|jgi:polyribonucleotide nucleotidyltransferase|nr:polyribonucleotide nucleotidyltransferase [Christensenellaceae bacterium]
MSNSSDYKKFETTIGGKKVLVETGALCSLSQGSCVITCGETVVMVNATMAKEPRDGVDFFPIGVDYQEKLYSVGKIPGAFNKREGRGGDSAILTSRLIDRPLRPLFPKGFYNDVAIVATTLSVDPDVAPEPLAMLGSSVALLISDIPFSVPTGSVLIARDKEGKFICNPSNIEREESDLHLIVSGTSEAVLMVEAGAKEVSEKDMIAAIMFAHEEIKKQCEFQLQIQKKVGKDKQVPSIHTPSEELNERVRAFATSYLEKALAKTDLEERRLAEEKVQALVADQFAEIWAEEEKDIEQVMYNIKKEIVRKKITKQGIRPDGRGLKEIRPIWCATGLLPRTHGSAVFTRGQTQILNVCTLGMLGDKQKLDGIDLDEPSKRYMHHYNMPPYATGEARQLRAPGRREIGHGALAERALEPVIPSEEEFPYAIRTVSEVLSSNGSSSMASVCGSSMSLMNAGVPIKSAVAGIAMGLIKDKESGKVAVLSDIQGLEDFLGDMDFKVAGTDKGITAIQMDIKIAGIDEGIITTALTQAKEGRMHIMGLMNKEIDKPASALSKYAPKIITFNINPDKIKDVIGSGGKVINKIIDETGVKIDIEDDGRVFIGGTEQAMVDKAKQIILDICFEPEIGQEFDGKVVRIMEFGAFVQFKGGKEGMVHISKLDKKRVEKVEDVVKIGDPIRVKVIKIDEKGRIDLMRIC